MALIIPCHRVLAAGGKIGGFPRQAVRRPRSACSRWRALISSATTGSAIFWVLTRVLFALEYGLLAAKRS